MFSKSFGFIGGGRIVTILLNALKNVNKLPNNICVSDNNKVVLEKLQNKFSGINVSEDNSIPAKCELVFISLHPPVIIPTLESIKENLKANSIIISLAPKVTINMIKDKLGADVKVVRLIPNAPSFINKGYNPVVFSANISDKEKSELLELLNIFGNTPEVDEEKLESYAIITAMGPTYFWFQMEKLFNLGKEFGLTEQELKKSMVEMFKGAVDTLFSSDLNFSEVIDLIPVKPLKENEKQIEEIYDNNLLAMFNKLKN